MSKPHIKAVDDEQYFNNLSQKEFEHLDYQKQTEYKYQHVIDQYHKYHLDNPVNQVVVADHPKYYRHKVTTTATNVKTHGKLTLRLGFFIENTHKIQPKFESFLHDKLIESTLKQIEKSLQKYKITAYKKGYNRGVIKHVMVRKSYTNNDLLVVFVTHGSLLPNHKHIIRDIRDNNDHVKSVIQIIQKVETHIVLYGEERILFGPGFIIDYIEGIQFKISAQSFYQINPAQMMKLYIHAFEYANIQKHEHVMDCYAGIGTISLLAAQKAQSVIAVEMNASAVKNAIENAKRNNISNVTFVKEDAETYMHTYQHPIDVLIIDPPRIGVSKAFIASIKRLKPKRIVYISCYVETQARDIKQLSSLYKVERIQPVDMFPYTTHVESVSLLHKKCDNKS